MYRHGSSARVGVGKRGHGGRDYRPPKQKNDPSKLVPPQLKECSCMVQLDVLEYSEVAVAAVVGRTSTPTGEEEQQQPQGRRLHLCFEGSSLDQRKKSLKNVEQVLRSGFGVHLVVPGRSQAGPVAVVGKSCKDTLPAVEYLMHRLVLTGNNDNNNNNFSMNSSNNRDDESQTPPTDFTEVSSSSPSFLKGRIMRNVKDPNDVVLSGRFLQQQPQPNHHHHRLVSQQQESSFCPCTNENTNNDGDDSDDDGIHLEPFWLFESESWSIMVCPLTLPSLPKQQQQQIQTAIVEALQVGFDNLQFRLGNTALSELDIFLHQPPSSASPPNSNTNANVIVTPPPKAFASGDPASACIQTLYREILQTRVV